MCACPTVEGAWNDTCQNFPQTRTSGYAVYSLLGRGGVLTPTKRFIAEGYWCWDTRFGLFLSAQAVWKQLSGAKSWRVQAGIKTRGACGDEISRVFLSGDTILSFSLYRLESNSCVIRLCLCFGTKLGVHRYCACRLRSVWRTKVVGCLVMMIALHSRLSEWWP